MDIMKQRRYKQLVGNGESTVIHKAEGSKTTKSTSENLEQPDQAKASSRQAKGREADSHNDRTPKKFSFGFGRMLADIEKGIFNYLGGLEIQHVNPAGGAHYNSAPVGGQTGHAPDSQHPSRSEGNVPNYLAGLEERLFGAVGGAYYNSAHPGGSAGYAADSQDPSREDLIVQIEGEPHRFTYNQLSVATGGFCEESKLGHGGFGSVYRGVLPSGLVAVKKMNHGTTQSQGIKEFKGEVSIISQLRHRNLVELLGWCEDSAKKEYMVVYELMPNGSLDDVLFHPVEGRTYLSWSQRFKIVTGTADALFYVHEGWKKQVIHRDVKCSNILLDKEWNAKLADFGIARLVDHQQQAATTNMAGTLGYIAPEVFIEGRFTDKTDVFAFGIMVLEVACGRRVLPSHPHEMGLVGWVRQSLSKGELPTTVDKRLKEYDAHQMKVMVMIGLCCCQSKPRERPSMRHVVQMLAGDAEDELLKMIAHIEEEISDSRAGHQFDWSPSDTSEIQWKNDNHSLTRI